MTSPSPSPAPGWYPDPTDPERVRYWNGGQWSQRTEPRWGAPTADAGGWRRREPAATAAGTTPVAPTDPPAYLRIPAGLIDVVAVTPFALLVTGAIWWRLLMASAADPTSLPVVSVADHALFALGTLAVWFGYGVVFTRYAGGTPGQLVSGLRVAPDGPGTRVGWALAAKRALVRGMIAALCSQALLGSSVALAGMLAAMVGYSLAVNSPSHRSLSDRAAGTRLVARHP